ncbi:MAG: hypothetical protein GW783_02525 [Deltaproteobacteria bacterium]|nr:hypothetical protein [Deltaproteobacteria bacterium]NCS72991.1 hypothetical protein [Deltaproteobacteria bacterium]PIU79869.1 MAG: hypothetical protein COS73_02265 [Nitrospirae bacterium CG06_land_8_20_14_3_00_70_43]
MTNLPLRSLFSTILVAVLVAGCARLERFRPHDTTAAAAAGAASAPGGAGQVAPPAEGASGVAEGETEGLWARLFHRHAAAAGAASAPGGAGQVAPPAEGAPAVAEVPAEGRWGRLFHRREAAAAVQTAPTSPGGGLIHPQAEVAPGVAGQAHEGRFARLHFWPRKASTPAPAGRVGGAPSTHLQAAVESLGGAGGPGLGVRQLRDVAPCAPLLAFLPDGSLLYADRGHSLARQGLDGRVARLGPLAKGPYAVAVAQSGRLLAVGDAGGQVAVWDLGSQRLSHRLTAAEAPITALTFTPEGRFLVVGDKGGGVGVWTAETGSRVSTLPRHGGAVSLVVTDGKRLWSGGWDKSLRLYDLASGRLVRRYTFPDVWGDAAAIDAGGHTFAMENYNAIRLWDLESGGELATLEGHKTWVRALRFGADGRSLLSAAEDGEAILWEIPAGTLVERWQPVADGCGVAIGVEGDALAVATHDGATLVPTGGVDDLLAVARLRAQGQEVDWSVGNNDLPPYPVAEVRSSPKNGQVVAGDRLSITVVLYNRGKGDLFRAKARLTSPHPALDGRTYYFGRVPPASRREWTETIDLPVDLAVGEIPFAIEFSEAAGYVPRGVEGALQVQALPRPEFLYSVRVVDDMSGDSVGNGDGVIQLGEAAAVAVAVRNGGAGPAHDVQVELTPVDTAGVAVRGLDRPIDLLAPDQVVEVTRTLLISPKVAVREVGLHVRIHEGGFGIDFTDRLSLPVDPNPPREIRPVTGNVKVNRPLEIRAGADHRTAAVAQVGPGDLLEAAGELPGWIQVKLAGERTGWVDATGVERQY